MIDTMNLRPCKQVAIAKLRPGHPVRDAILAEPDEVPRTEGRVKLLMLAEMLARQGP